MTDMPSARKVTAMTYFIPTFEERSLLAATSALMVLETTARPVSDTTALETMRDVIDQAAIRYATSRADADHMYRVLCAALLPR